MARVQNTLIGRASGRVGATVFYTQNLQNVIRALAPSWYNPNTIPQRWQRAKYGYIVGVFRELEPVFNVGFKGVNRGKSIFNHFMQFNVPNAFIDKHLGGVQLVPEKLVLSKGMLYPTAITYAIWQVPYQQLTLGWSVNVTNNQSSTDIASVIIFNETLNKFFYVLTGEPRSMEQFQDSFGFNFQTGQRLHIWLFFTSQILGINSVTTYISINVT